MTENLYETNQFTNHSNGTYLFQHSPSTLGAPHYGVPNINSIQSSPMSPPLNHEQLTSPGTPGHELSPMLEMPNSGGTWEYNQFGRTSSWGSSPHEELPETSRIYPFNITCQNNSSMTCKDSGSVSHAQRLDSFSKAFPTKNIELLFGDSYRTDDKHPENHISGVLHMPQSLPEDQTGKVWSLLFLTQWSFKVNAIRPASIHQKAKTQCTAFTKTINSFTMDTSNKTEIKQHRAGKQESPKTTELLAWLSKSPNAISDGLEPTTKRDLCTQNSSGFSWTCSIANLWPPARLQSARAADLPLPRPTTSSFAFPTRQSLPRARSRAIDPAKQNNMFNDARHSAPNTPVFTSPKEDQSGFNFPRRREDLCSPLYQTRAQGSVKLFHRWLWGRSFSSSHSTCSSVGTGTVFLIWLLHYRLICI